MTSREIHLRLVRQLQGAWSMELAAASALDPLVEQEADSGLAALVDAHRRNSRAHRERLLARLRALGALPPAGARIGAGILAAARGGAGARASAADEEQLRQAVLMKQLEVATYDVVERLAHLAGDDATARLAREARTDDEELTRRLVRRRLRAQRRD